jgi:probable HAF family extracellular repeat protein
MVSRRLFIARAALLSGGLLLPVSRTGAQQAPAYTVTDIGMPENAIDVRPVALTSDGAILLNATVDDRATVFVYEGDEFAPYGDPEQEIWAIAMDVVGGIAGWIGLDGERTRAVLIEREHIVEMPGDMASSRALGINGEGMTVGEAAFNDADGSTMSPVYWTDTGVERLPSIGDGSAGSARDINTIGQIAGWSAMDAENAVRRATLWSDDQATDLGTLGGDMSEAHAINEIGQVAGISTTETGQDISSPEGQRPFLWADGAMTDLGLAEHMTWGAGYDINVVGLVAGVAGIDAGPNEADTVAALWTGNSALDLNQVSTVEDAGLRLTEAVAVDDLGRVLCMALDADGNSHVALLEILGN